jgi:hypothetical protein
VSVQTLTQRGLNRECRDGGLSAQGSSARQGEARELESLPDPAIRQEPAQHLVTYKRTSDSTRALTQASVSSSVMCNLHQPTQARIAEEANEAAIAESLSQSCCSTSASRREQVCRSS